MPSSGVLGAYLALAEARLDMLQAVAGHDARDSQKRQATLSQVEAAAVEVVVAEQGVWVAEQSIVEEARRNAA